MKGFLFFFGILSLLCPVAFSCFFPVDGVYTTANWRERDLYPESWSETKSYNRNFCMGIIREPRIYYLWEKLDQPVEINAIPQMKQDSIFSAHLGGLPEPLSKHVEKMMDTSEFSTHYELGF